MTLANERDALKLSDALEGGNIAKECLVESVTERAEGAQRTARKKVLATNVQKIAGIGQTAFPHLNAYAESKHSEHILQKQACRSRKRFGSGSTCGNDCNM